MAKASRFTNGVIVRDGRPSSPAGDTSETKLTQLRIIEASVTPVAVATVTVADQDLTVAGVTTSDNFIQCIKTPITTAVALVECRQNGANTVKARFVNPTAGSVTPTAGTYVFLVGRYSNT